MTEARAVEPGAAKIEVASGLRLSEESHANVEPLEQHFLQRRT